jgi:membrane protein implicated in regulation of membrane protease activity
MCLWLGVGAGLTGLAALLVPELGWRAELIILAASTILVAIAGNVLLRRRGRAPAPEEAGTP